MDTAKKEKALGRSKTAARLRGASKAIGGYVGGGIGALAGGLAGGGVASAALGIGGGIAGYQVVSKIGDQIWFYLFLGSGNGFSSEPLTIEESLLDLTTIRPSNLSLVPGGVPKLAVSFGSPVRKGMVFDIEILNDTAYIREPSLLSAPIIVNGYGVVYLSLIHI